MMNRNFEVIPVGNLTVKVATLGGAYSRAQATTYTAFVMDGGKCVFGSEVLPTRAAVVAQAMKHISKKG